MICSDCNKNPAIIFYEKIDNGKNTMEGLCFDCAKKRGITVVYLRQHRFLEVDGYVNTI